MPIEAKKIEEWGRRAAACEVYEGGMLSPDPIVVTASEHPLVVRGLANLAVNAVPALLAERQELLALLREVVSHTPLSALQAHAGLEERLVAALKP